MSAKHIELALEIAWPGVVATTFGFLFLPEFLFATVWQVTAFTYFVFAPLIASLFRRGK